MSSSIYRRACSRVRSRAEPADGRELALRVVSPPAVAMAGALAAVSKGAGPLVKQPPSAAKAHAALTGILDRALRAGASRATIVCTMDLPSTCGQLVIGGFTGTSLPPRYEAALKRSRRVGAILFASNVEGGPAQAAALARQVHAALPSPLLGIDQEGGRVARIRAPLIQVPPMRTIASWGDTALAEEIAHAVGTQLAAMGCTINFAPVLDVNTCPSNPVIGDRAFGSDADTCARFGVAWIRGLQRAGLLATAKHFPGHGDTSLDSHLALPTVDRPLEHLEEVSLVPFRAAVNSGVAAMMTAHVVHSALDLHRPATLSYATCTQLRERIGFDGLLVSDDLEMKAIAAHWSSGDAAVQAVAAGCDVLLVCGNFEPQEVALESLVREAESSSAFRARCRQACARVAAARKHALARPLEDQDIERIVAGEGSRAVSQEITRRLQR
jgi:beta-N-acetylhexosaminidase